MNGLYGGCLWGNAGVIGIKHRHNAVHDTLVDICFWSGISTGKEVDIGLGSSPLTQTGMADFVPGRAVIDAAQRKRGKYMTKCADIGYEFLPFSFSYFGELEKDAVTLLKRVRKFSMAQDIGALWKLAAKAIWKFLEIMCGLCYSFVSKMMKFWKL
ncbi:hypothetical protein Tco_0528897 [Tanacetum coccineum]